MNKVLSVIIPTYNRDSSLARSLQALLRQKTFLSKIIIVDDGSVDQTPKIICDLQKEHDLIECFRQDNKGYQSALNFGLQFVTSELVAIIDDDSVICDNWAEVVIETFSQYTFIAALGGPIINSNNSVWGKVFDIINFSKWNAINKIQYIYDIPTCNAIYRKESIKGIYFLEDYKNIGYRDSIFNYELIKKGGKIIFNPQLRIKHNTHGKDLTLDNLIESLRRKARGFFFGGYICHGRGGYLVKCVPILYYLTFFLFIKRSILKFSSFLELCLLSPLIVFAQTIFILELTFCWLKTWVSYVQNRFYKK